MELIMFSKMLKEKSMQELVSYAQEVGIGGYDLAVRSGYAVNPENVKQALPEFTKLMKAEGLSVPMVTAGTDITRPGDEGVRPLLSAMDAADVRLLKIGYFKFDPDVDDYQVALSRVKKAFEGWEQLGREYNVKACYHTHSNRCMGLNAGSLAHLVEGRDPSLFGVFLDPGHLRAEGEEFDFAVAMVRPFLSIVALKDFLLTRIEKNGHGAVERTVVPAGHGMVDWTLVFQTLKAQGFQGPLTVHCEFEVPPESFHATVKREIRVFKDLM